MSDRDNDYLYRPLTKEQLELADKLTEKFDQNFFVEKRDPDTRIRPGILMPHDPAGQALRVMVTESQEQPGVRVLISNRPFDEIAAGELILDLPTGQKIRMRGRAEPTRPGHRQEDTSHEPPLHVSYFHPDRK